MKLLILLALSVFSPTICRAMTYSDSRFVTRDELAGEGIELLALPQAGGGLVVTVRFRPPDKAHQLQFISYSVLEHAPDASFTTELPKRTEIEDLKKWAKERRGDSTTRDSLKFSVAASEIPKTYILVALVLPPKDGIAVFGRYFILLRDLKNG